MLGNGPHGVFETLVTDDPMTFAARAEALLNLHRNDGPGHGWQLPITYQCFPDEDGMHVWVTFEAEKI